MKVPIYRAQTGPVKTGGQAMLTAVADPGVMGSAAGASARQFQQLTQLGLSVAENELKIYRETQLQEQLAEMRKKENVEKNKVLNEPYPSKTKQFNRLDRVNKRTVPTTITSYTKPSDAVKGQIPDLRKQINSQASRMSDAVARRRFKNEAEKRLILLEPQLLKVMRKRYIDYSGAQVEGRLLALADDYLMASKGQKELVRQDVRKLITDSMANGIMGQKAGLKRLNEWESSVTMGEVRAEMVAASKTKNPDKLFELSNEVQNPKGRFKKLTSSARGSLSLMLHNKGVALESKLLREARTKTANDLRAEKIRHNKAFNGFMLRISKYRQGLRGGDSPEDLEAKGVTMPSLDEVGNSFSANQISGDHRRSLERELTNPSEQNDGLIKDFKRQIENAVTRDDLEAIKKRVESSLDKSAIVLKSRNDLVRQIDGLVKKVPEEIAASTFEKRFDNHVVQTDLLSRFSGQKELSTLEAKARFRSLIYDQDMTPAEAYFTVLGEMYKSTGAIFKNTIATLPEHISRSLLTSEGKVKKFEKIKMADIQLARQRWINSLSRQRERLPKGVDPQDLSKFDIESKKKRDRVLVRHLFRTELQLDYIEESIRSRDEELERALRERQNATPEEKGTWEQILDLFGRSSSSGDADNAAQQLGS